MIYHTLGQDGSFTCGDSVTGITVYAYPTSQHATEAKKNADKTAIEMLANEIASLHCGRIGQEYDLNNWKRIHTDNNDHTVRGIIDSVMSQFER